MASKSELELRICDTVAILKAEMHAWEKSALVSRFPDLAMVYNARAEEIHKCVEMLERNLSGKHCLDNDD